MHEYSIVQALLERVDDEARARRAARVHRLEVRLGELSGVDGGLLATAFDTCREGTLCAGAELSITPVAAVWSCPRCDGKPEPGTFLRCKACNLPAQLEAGDEILLTRIEMEVDAHV